MATAQSAGGAESHYRALEQLYRSAAINTLFSSRLQVVGEGRAEIRFAVTPEVFHAAGAAHGTIYFKMLDDAAFYAANTLVTDRFLLTTAFNLLFTKPVGAGEVRAEGRWVSGRRRVLIAESRLVDDSGEEIGRGTGTFMRSRIPLSSLPGYDPAWAVGDRLPTHLEVAGWRRAVEAAGGFAAILQSGDADSGSVLMLTIENGGNPRLWERMPQLDGSRVFTLVNAQSIDNAEELSTYLQRRTRQDSDLWIVELDIANPERFIELRQD